MTETTANSKLSSIPERNAETIRIARHAGLIAVGSAAGRILGLSREIVKSHYFGAGAQADALTIALRVPILLYDLFMGGMISSSLVPMFVKYRQQGREHLWELLSILTTLGAILFASFTLLLILLATPIATFMSAGSAAAVQAQTAALLRLTAPAALFLGLSGILMGALYALQRFAFPAFAAAVLNAGMVAGALLFQDRLGPAAMALGLLAGAFLQFALQRRGLRDAPLRRSLNWRHPGLRRLGVLYAPIFLGLLVEVLLSRPLTYRLASFNGTGSIARMEYAQILSHFPRGLVALGVAAAVLPLLATHAAQERAGSGIAREAFRATLARGQRLILVFILPAALGLLLLARPVIALLLEHGSFLAADTLVTARALQLYLLALPVAAVDGLLVYAFFARQDTLTPALVGVGTVILYLALAFLLQPTLGLYSIMVADGIKLILHLLLLLIFLARKLDGFGRYGVLHTLMRTLPASAVMGLAIGAVLSGLPALELSESIVRELRHVLLPALAGLTVYVLAAAALGIDELLLLGSAIQKQFIGKVSHD